MKKQRYLVAAGTQNYKKAGAPSLDQVPLELKGIRALFARFGYERALEDEVDLDPETESLKTRLENWFFARDEGDTAVIYYTGHGFEQDGIHYLMTASTLEQGVTSALETDVFLRLLGTDAKLRRLLVIVDACYAGKGARDLMGLAQRMAARQDQRAFGRGEGIWIVATARAREEADQSAFVHALTHAVDVVSCATHESQEYLAFDALFEQVNQWLEDQGFDQVAGFAPVGLVHGLPPFLPNPGYADTSATAQLYEHAPAIADVVAQAPSRFAGRAAALAALHAVPAGSLRVVLGRPGSGKSALLAQFATRRAEADPAAIVAVQARGKTAEELASELNAPTKPRPEGRRTVVIDSLDEAVDPTGIAAHLRDRLVAHPDETVLVACRTNSLPDALQGIEAVDLDSATYLRRDDVAGYVADILLDRPLFAGRGDDVRRLSAAIAERAAGSFAVAAVAARTLASGDRIPTVDDLHVAALPDSLAAAFDAEMERWGDDAERLQDLLAPLAWSRGAGLPWETLWAPLASTLTGHARYRDEDVRWLLDHAGAYVLETQVVGSTVFRVFHEELAAHLRQRYSGTPQQAESTIVDTILHGVKDWSVASRYAREQLAGHARDAGRLDELLAEASFLVAADVDGLLSVLDGAISGAAQGVADVYAIASDQLRDARPEQRAATLGLVARQQGQEPLATALDPLSAGARWRCRWTDWAPVDLHRTITRMPGSVTAIATTDTDGRPLVAVGDSTGTLCVLDLASDRCVLEVQLAQPISTIAWLDATQPWQLAVGDRTGIVHLWRDVDDGDPVRLSAHERSIGAIAPGILEGRPILATTGQRSGAYVGTVRAWDAETLVAIGPEVDAFPGAAFTVDVVENDGAPILLVAGDPVYEHKPARPLRGFDPRTGRQRLSMSIGPFGYARTIAVHGTEVLVACHDKLIRYDLAAKRETASINTARLAPHAIVFDTDAKPMVGVVTWSGIDFLTAVDLQPDAAYPAIVQQGIAVVGSVVVDGHAMILTGGDDGAVRIWDAVRRTTPPARALPDVRAVAPSGSRVIDVRRPGRIAVHDARHGRPLPAPSAGPKLSPILATGQLASGVDVVFVVAEHDRLARFELRDNPVLVDAATVGQLWAIATHRMDDGRLLVATAHMPETNSHSVRLWDGATFEPLSDELELIDREDKMLVAVAFAELSGGLAVVAGGHARRVVGWNVAAALASAADRPLPSSALTIDVIAPLEAAITCLAVAPGAGAGTLLAGTDEGALIGITLPSGGLAFWRGDLQRARIDALAAGRIGDHTIVATADATGVLNIWTLASEPELLFAIPFGCEIADVALDDRAVFVATARGLTVLDIHP
jgi:WD40 repeat protein